MTTAHDRTAAERRRNPESMPFPITAVLLALLVCLASFIGGLHALDAHRAAHTITGGDAAATESIP